MPAPDTFGTQFTNSPYLGDKSPRKKGVEGNMTWDPTNTNGAAVTLAEYLGWSNMYNGGSSVPDIFSDRDSGELDLNANYSPLIYTNERRYNNRPPVNSSSEPDYRTDGSDFRDATWERYGYDLDVAQYIAKRDTLKDADGNIIKWDPRWDWGGKRSIPYCP